MNQPDVGKLVTRKRDETSLHSRSFLPWAYLGTWEKTFRNLVFCPPFSKYFQHYIDLQILISVINIFIKYYD